MWYVTTFLGFLVFVLVMALLAAPLYLVIRFPEAGANLTAISRTLIPWLSIVLLLLVFNEGVKQVFGGIAGALHRLRKLGAGGVTSEFEEQQRDVLPLTAEQVQQLAEHIDSLATAKEGESAWAWHFFIKYVSATIYGSQVKLLKALRDEGPQDPVAVLPFYELFLQREPESSQYRFESYVQYLVSNVLIRFDSETSQYEITEHGKRFLAVLDEHQVNWATLRG